MSRKRIPLWNFSPTSNDRIVLDTNILIKIFHPLNYSASEKDEEYEEFYAALVRNKSMLLLSSVQISEYINRCIRIQFGLYKRDNQHANTYQFKEDYRGTRDYLDNMNSIINTVKDDIIPYFSTIDDGFKAIAPENIYLCNISYDFNDALLAEITKAQNAYLVTDDSDFINYSNSIDLITNNNWLLSCR